MGVLTHDKIKEYAQWSFDEYMHTNEKLTCDIEGCGGQVKVVIRHPTKHNRVFKVIFETDDIDNCDIVTNTLVDHQYREEFTSRFMTYIFNHLESMSCYDSDSE